MKRPRQATIRQAINACPELGRSEKQMLVEVCTLYSCGSDGTCTASNKHFMQALVINRDAVARILARLESKGFANVHIAKEEGNKRTIVPTEKALSLYQKVDTPIEQKSIGYRPKESIPYRLFRAGPIDSPPQSS